MGDPQRSKQRNNSDNVGGDSRLLLFVLAVLTSNADEPIVWPSDQQQYTDHHAKGVEMKLSSPCSGD